VKCDGLFITTPEESRLLVWTACAVFDRYLESRTMQHSRTV